MRKGPRHRNLPHLPRPHDLVLRRSQLHQCEWAAAVQFLSADAHLRAEAELSAIGETRRRIPIDDRRIDATQKLAGIRFVVRHDRVGMFRRVTVDMCDGFIDASDDVDRNAQTQIFLIPVLLGRGTNVQSGGQGAGFAIAGIVLGIVALLMLVTAAVVYISNPALFQNLQNAVQPP